MLDLQASYGGEDAYFVSEQHGFAFGVADGVGGWANSGINPAGQHSHLTCIATACKNVSHSAKSCNIYTFHIAETVRCILVDLTALVNLLQNIPRR